MSIRIKTISNPIYMHAGTVIDVDMQTEEVGDIKCTLAPGDEQSHVFDGEELTLSELFRRAKRGEFGEVASAK